MSKTSFDKFGIDEETYNKSKDILPTFDIGKIEVGSAVYLTVKSKEPKQIETKSKYNNEKKGIKKGDTLKTNSLTVVVERVERNTDEEVIDVPYNDDLLTLWLSSQSLTLGLLKIFKENKDSLENVKVKISITTVVYKEFGENRCYNVVKQE